VTAEITLVLGGARSGKSEVAERLALGLGTAVTYVATAETPDGDAEWAERVRRHRERRPRDWDTVELPRAGDLGAVLRATNGPALVDSLGTWIAGLADFGDDDTPATLARALESRREAGHPTIVVSEEVGLGVHPSTAAGRLFRDALGLLNREVASVSDCVLLVVAGRVLALGREAP
jgi:adenosylcobinamide kinase / adenosylcobinamide-phosphate guanylyltransferase